jgi:hypothetical protein
MGPGNGLGPFFGHLVRKNGATNGTAHSLGPIAAVGHADGHFDHLVHRLLAAALGPLFEIQILILQGIRGCCVQPR